MIPCDGTRDSKKWCCGETLSCCDSKNNPDAVFLAQTLGQPAPTRSVSNATESSAVSLSLASLATPTQSTQSTNGDQESGELSIGAKQVYLLGLSLAL
jgi:hypothetical protein